MDNLAAERLCKIPDSTVFKSIEDEIVSIYLVDLDNDIYRIIKVPNTTRVMSYRSDYIWSKAAADFAGEVSEDTRDVILRMADINLFREDLMVTDRKEYIYRLKNETVSWRRGVVKVIDRIDGRPVLLSLTISYFDSKATGDEFYVSSLEKQKTLLVEGLKRIKGLATEYQLLRFYNLKTGEFTNYYTAKTAADEPNQLIYSIGDYKSNHEESVRRFCHPDYAEEMRKFSENDYIRHVLDNKKKYVMRFLSDTGRGYRWTEYVLIKIDPVDEPATEVAIGFIDVDDIVRIEMAKDAAFRAQTDIVTALSSDFSNVYNVNAHKDEVNIIKLEGRVIEDFKDWEQRKKAFPYSKIFGDYIFDRVHPEDRSAMLELLNPDKVDEILSKTGEYTGTYRIFVEGEISYFEFKLMKLKDSGQVILAFRNIDSIVMEEKRKAQALEEALMDADKANRAKTTFLNNMSHDIRTPMNAIMGFTTLAKKHIEDRDAVLEYLSKIDISGKHLLRLINDVLDMSRIESGKVTIEERVVHIPEIMDDLATIVQADIDAKSQTFIVDFGSVSNNYIITDRLRINQILLNIVSNAIKYTPEGGRIAVKVLEKPGRMTGYSTYEFRVKDNGIGMSKDFSEHIFEAFTREKTSTVSKIEGTGLGMAITKHIVDMLGGTITVNSEQGKGTEFVVTLDCKLSDKTEASHKTSGKSVKSNSSEGNADNNIFKGKKILLVEDNPLNQEIAVDILSEAGFNVFVASDGDIAVEKLRKMRKGDYDLVLMDIQMPRMDGYTATKYIRKLDNKYASAIPIIAMTANAFDEDRKQALDCGMNEFVAKPVKIHRLMDVMMELMS